MSVDISSILLRINSSVNVSTNNYERLNGASQHFMRQKCPDAYATLSGLGNTMNVLPQILNPIQSKMEINQLHQNPTAVGLVNSGNVNLALNNHNLLSGGSKRSHSNSKKRFMKKMTALAKKYQNRDNCSWKKALKKEGKKISNLD